jgi:hypothetical protein
MHPGSSWGSRQRCPPRDLARAQTLLRLPLHRTHRAQQAVPPQLLSQRGREHGRARRAPAACDHAGALPAPWRGAAVPPGGALRTGACAALHVDLPGVSVALKSPREDEAPVLSAHAEDYWLPPGELSHIERRGGAGEHDVFRCFGCTRPACQVCGRRRKPALLLLLHAAGVPGINVFSASLSTHRGALPAAALRQHSEGSARRARRGLPGARTWPGAWSLEATCGTS